MGRLPPVAGPSRRGSVLPPDRSRANEDRSWATSTTSRRVPSGPPSWSTSARIEAVVRDRCLPRNEGMAQKPQFLSHPSATLMYDHGADAAGRGRFNRSNEGRGSEGRGTMLAEGADLRPSR